MTDAEKWLVKFRNGEINPPDVDAIRFDDGSMVEWDGAKWELGRTLSTFKNPDGKTYNGVAFLSHLTGIPEDQIRADWEKAKNARKED